MQARITLLLSVFLFCAVLVSAQQPQGDITVEAEGYGSSGNDAILKAKREAVEKGIGTILISETEVKNFILQKDVILTKTIGAVKSYDLLKEQMLPDGLYYAKIRAVVSTASIKEDLMALKILLESMDKPRMMVLIHEEKGNSAETAILDYLKEKEFELVDPAAVAALMQKEDALIIRATQGDPVAAAKLGAENGAEYVLVGQVNKGTMDSSLLQDTGMKSGQANITAKVVNASTARIVASKASQGAYAHISEEIAQAKATDKAARNLMDRKLFETIVSSFQDMINNGITYDVTVKNVKDFKMQKNIMKAFNELEVVSVNKRSFTGGVLKLSVVFKGNADAFGEAVDGKSVSDKKLSVNDMVGNRIGVVVE